jgi:hypothetical protein
MIRLEKQSAHMLLNDDFPRHTSSPKRRRTSEAEGQGDDEPNEAGHEAAAWIDGHRVDGLVTKVTSMERRFSRMIDGV